MENITTKTIVLKILVFCDNFKTVRNGLLKTVSTKTSFQKKKLTLFKNNNFLKNYMKNDLHTSGTRLNYVHQFDLYHSVGKLMQGKI